jgi:hypothetical protein
LGRFALDFIIVPLSIILSAGILLSETQETLLGAFDVLEGSDIRFAPWQ